jgi:hypothetical protein
MEPERIRGQREAVRHPHAGRRQPTNHLAERRVLAADLGDIIESHVAERQDVRSLRGTRVRHGVLP